MKNKLTKKEQVIIKFNVDREKHIDFQFEECETKAENEYYRLSRLTTRTLVH